MRSSRLFGVLCTTLTLASARFSPRSATSGQYATQSDLIEAKNGSKVSILVDGPLNLTAIDLDLKGRTSDLQNDTNALVPRVAQNEDDDEEMEDVWDGLPPEPLPDPIDDDGWDAALCKGLKLLSAMQASDFGASQLFHSKPKTAASPFKDFPALFWNWGYIDYPTDQDGDADMYVWGIAETLQRMGVSDSSQHEGGTNYAYRLLQHDEGATDKDGKHIPVQEQTYTHKREDGTEVEYPCSGAYHWMSMNPKDGVVVVKTTRSIKGWVKNQLSEIPPQPVPAALNPPPKEILQHASDITWGLWKWTADRTKENIQNIDTFIALGVNNPLTTSIVARILNDLPEDQRTLTTYPGVTVLTSSMAGRALLGSPNGLMFSQFLIQHKAELGKKEITQIQIFHHEPDVEVRDFDAPELTLAYKVEDARDW